ncbi:MAG: PAS domain S-box protein [Thermostichus sp. DG_1_6_bins_120]
MDLSALASGSPIEPELFYVLGSSGCLEQLSGNWQSCLGYEPSELRAQPCLHFLHADDWPVFQSWLEQSRQGKPLPPLTLHFRQQQGSYQPLHWKGAWAPQAKVWIGSAYPVNIGTPSKPILSTQQSYLATLVEIQQRLLHLKSTSRQQIYNAVLEPLAQACKASRVYIFENHRDPQEPERLLMSQKAEWCQTGISPQIHNPHLQNLPYDQAVPSWPERLARGEAIAGLVSHMDPPERSILEAQGILSILILPLIVEEQFFGLIGFDHCEQPYIWSEAEIHLLQAAATALALALEHKQVESRLLDSQRHWEMERQETTTALKESQNLFQTVFRQAAIGIGVADTCGRLVAYNKTYASMLGYTSEELEQLTQITFIELTHPEDLGKDLTLNQELLEGKRDSFRIEKRYIRKGGDPLWVDITVSLVRDATGQPQFTFAMVQDIHERKRAEQELQLLQSLTQAISEVSDFQSALEVMMQQVCVVTGWDLGEAWIPQGEDLVRGAAWHNRGKASLLFHQGSALYRFGLGQGLPGRIWLERRPVWYEDVTRLSTREFHRVELAQQAGLRACFGVPILADETVVAVLVFYLVRARPQEQRLVNLVKAAAAQLGSVMQRKQAEEALRQAEEKYRGIYENSLEGIFQTTPAGTYVSANPALARIYGYDSPEELIREITDIEHCLYVDPRRRQTFVQELETRGSISHFESQVYRKDGSIIWISESARAVRDPQGQTLYYEGFVEDITERKKVERLKNEFVSTVSHELRTPLTSIRGALGLISGGVGGQLPPQVQSLVEIALKNSERLVMLINDILDIEKIESGKMQFEIRPVELMGLLQQAIEANRAYAAQFDVELVLDPTLYSTTGIPLTGIQVNVDPNRLMQVMNNLLSNAAKFSPPGQTVRVWAEQVQEGIRVCVQDRGPGIPEEFRSRIFQKFAQADSSDTRQKGGTGLGLSISKAIVERFGGTIGFVSNPAPNQQGTTFYFTLPQWQSASPPALEKPTDGAVILVCEDDPDIAMLLELILQQGGFQVDIASTAAEAKSCLQTRHYAAMTLDLSLPDQDGLSLVEDLRQMEGLGNLPIVVVSATAEQRRQAEWLRCSSELNKDSTPLTNLPADKSPLARKAAHRATSEALSVMAEYPAKLIAWLNKPIDQEQLVAAVQQATGQNYRLRPQILHVEDDPDILQVVAQILQNTAELAHAHCLQEACQLLQTRQFQLVILDLYLPDGSGLELLPLLRKDSVPPTRTISTTPVVIFSAQDIDSDSLKEQIQATLVKARTSNQEFLDTIRALVSKKIGWPSIDPTGYFPSGGG